MEQQQAAAMRERDLALAMHETFLGSGSEDALSPRFQNLDIRSPPSSFVSHPRASTPRHSAPPAPASASPAGALSGLEGPRLSLVGQQLAQRLRQKKAEQLRPKDGARDKLDEQKGGGEHLELQFEACVERLRETEFEHHETGAARLNNGSFGTCPKSVLLLQEQWMQRWLAQPDDMYYEGSLDEGLLASRQIVAAHVNCPTEELVLVDNVTVAASAVAMDVMWSFIQGQFQKGDCVLLSNFTYAALAITFEAYAVRAGASILTADLPFPISSSREILDAYEGVLRKAKKERKVIRLALLDHVVSMPSIILPIKELVALCRSYGVEQVFVDGAQAVGNVPQLDVTEIGADYYAGNLHKWFFAPTAVAFFHCKAKHLSRLHHPIVSHNYGKGLAAECVWMGTRDFSPMLAVPAAFEFFNKIPGGYAAVRSYNHKKIIDVGKMLAESWGTDIGVAPELCGSMVMVGLPPSLGMQTEEEAMALRTRLRNEFSIEVHTFTPSQEQADNLSVKGVTTYLRVSHQVYNTWAEYLRLKDVINGLVAEKPKQ